MKKNILGILGLLIAIFAITAVLNPKFISAYNMQNLVKWSSLYSIMGVGVAFVIITGGSGVTHLTFAIKHKPHRSGFPQIATVFSEGRTHI